MKIAVNIGATSGERFEKTLPRSHTCSNLDASATVVDRCSRQQVRSGILLSELPLLTWALQTLPDIPSQLRLYPLQVETSQRGPPPLRQSAANQALSTGLLGCSWADFPWNFRDITRIVGKNLTLDWSWTTKTMISSDFVNIPVIRIIGEQIRTMRTEKY